MRSHEAEQIVASRVVFAEFLPPMTTMTSELAASSRAAFWRMAENRLNLRVARLPHDEDLIALLLKALCRMVHALHIGAGGVHDVKPPLARRLLDLRDDAVGAQHERRAGFCGNVGDDGDALGGQVLDDLGVVDERAQRVDGTGGLAGHLLYEVKSALDAIAGAGVLGYGDLRH